MSKSAATPPRNPACPHTLARGALTLSAAAVPLLLAACGGSSHATAQDSSPTTQQSSSSGVTCNYPDAPQGKTGDASKPPTTPDVQGQVTVTMSTTIGTLKATLDADKAPCTVNSFVSLAKQGYFEKSPCHRLTTAGIYVLQCGDPTGTGTGGPGYTVPDELSGKETYGAGTLAMAEGQQPNTGGSQFFIVYQDSSASLQPLYTVFGHLDASGLADVQKMAKKGSDNSTAPGDGHPNEPVTIQSVTVG